MVEDRHDLQLVSRTLRHLESSSKLIVAICSGDSYTTTYFDPNKGPQPSISNPTGNPPYGTKTSCNGPNWIEFLTYDYNNSIIRTYNLASGGATMNESVIKPAFPLTRSMRSQIEDVFVPRYGGDERLQGHNTLFTFWIGINDIALTQMLPNLKALPATLLHSYRSMVQTVYDLGARNFLFINVPPIDRAPWANGFSAEGKSSVRSNIAMYNDGLASMVANLRASYSNATILLFDAHSLFNGVLDDPRSQNQTSCYSNVTDYCGAYANGTPERNTSYEECGVSVEEYFWLNTLHPTFPIHRATAAAIAQLLGGVNVTTV